MNSGPCLSGRVVRPGDEAFDGLVDDRFNQGAGGRPRAVAVAESAADVQDTVRAAAYDGTGGAVRATGHDPSVSLDGAYLIDTRRLDLVHVDVEVLSATVGAGVGAQAVLDAADYHDLTPLAGSNPGVGVVGYTLGGGMGLLGRRFGFAADRVRSAASPRTRTRTCSGGYAAAGTTWASSSR